ncbi:DUF4422 domain-containing protein [Mesobacillus foraminis]|uniref:DUF4422 domain-containing protein n=1 Tax=Mesobacillus foraminis TaxID=279826 RepID=UPI001BEAC5E3|nr:DUF4422 domain-containing protein [Mesobacillus foraminis]MBT2756709.1 DUF4422 domain-containing protein [Mesobacillus foraminis]
MENIKILVATHKKYPMPAQDIYLPIHVGREGKKELGYLGDNTGDNISLKNENFCELTGLYWAWKNLECDYIGLCHYRRYFSIKNPLKRVAEKQNKFDLILNEDEVIQLLRNNDVILPSKRNYYIETIWTHYKNAHHIKDLEETKNIISELYPEYLDSFDLVMQGKTLNLYNMFIMKKKDFDNYCKWLFGILFELEKRSDISEYDSYQKRIYGFISERLFNVWLRKHKELLSVKEIPAVNIERINWGKKIIDFVRRKVS